ncbi:DUF1735 domain-containing protein [Niabella beijingensis]|uniref:DUF1735 domain-containing protein n=1 Tax=Niabella beijingensis TaxID=2872700 RepID=UPI001CBBFC05|nr:DUF1735 domain-containing protein [Niabella beijingensis]MBZ4187338.1 DUF1735 domain-containing protein [Niabella beijingensis]
MKKNIYSYIILALALFSCSKEPPVNVDVPDPGQYANVYMPRAVVNNPYTTGLPLADTTYAFSYNAYLGGISPAASDLAIQFEVKPALVDSFNERYNTDYAPLPGGSYQFEQHAVIPRGQRSTATLSLHIRTSDVEPFRSYMLPLGVTAAGGQPISNINGTTYYIFTRSYVAAIEPRQKVLSLGPVLDWANKDRIILARGRQNTLVARHKNNDLNLYSPKADGSFDPVPKVIGVDWNASESWYYINETDIVVRNYPYWAGLFYFKWEPDLTMHQASPVWEEWWLGDFWDKYATIIPFKNYFLLVEKSSGNLLRQPLLSRVDAPKTTVGADFGNYRQVMAWQGYLLALGFDGNLWLYKMSEEAVPGDRILVGTGWNMYERLTVIDKDILALDANGDLYRYKFDPARYIE